MSDRVPITYTFGNHMHWVDFEWLWGYRALPSSVKDMLHFCKEIGAKGNVNFDGIGYEKMASFDPAIFAELKAAVLDGTVEIVGASYGQPYGLFHGGESNIRQRVYGVRTVRRLFGVSPKTFWEEEFDFFPQLPQILKGCGFEYASLFFQWTWHTPEVPRETVPVVRWESPDGSSLVTATRNRLNLHQWPEDTQILMDELAETGSEEGSLILQWLELMPSPDWMCRSEVLLPKTRELLGDPRFDVRYATLGEYLADAPEDLPVRRYTMDDVWHGMSLGKNADRHPRRSHEIERQIQEAEFLHSLLGRFGRPYAQWDVYPTWELEEAWRNLLAAQHHDNHECEALCGRVGQTMFLTAESLINTWQGKKTLGERAIPGEGGSVIVNSLGWERRLVIPNGEGRTAIVTVPPFGYRVVSEGDYTETPRGWVQEGDFIAFRARDFEAEINIAKWTVSLRVGTEKLEFELPAVEWTDMGQKCRSHDPGPKVDGGDRVFFWLKPRGDCAMWLEVPDTQDALDLTISFEPSAPCDPGIANGVHAIWKFSGDLRVDQPYGISKVHPHGKWPRKYPSGDWMTSPQWFETIENPFTSQSFVDVLDPKGGGLLLLHDGSQQWLQDGDSLRCVLTMRDPWDEDDVEKDARTRFRIIPHASITNTQRYRLSKEFADRFLDFDAEPDETRQPDMPAEFSLAESSADNVTITALFRESEFTTPNGEVIDYPYVLRLVEFDGVAASAQIAFGGTIARVFKTNHLGEEAEELAVTDGQVFEVPMRPYEIATVYLDLVEGRKQHRDLDAARKVWATVHRI